MTLIINTPQTLDMVYGPSKDAVGRVGPSLAAAVDKGKVNANGTTRIPSNQTQFHSALKEAH